MFYWKLSNKTEKKNYRNKMERIRKGKRWKNELVSYFPERTFLYFTDEKLMSKTDQNFQD